jgi:hypothetical protein
MLEYEQVLTASTVASATEERSLWLKASVIG